MYYYLKIPQKIPPRGRKFRPAPPRPHESRNDPAGPARWSHWSPSDTCPSTRACRQRLNAVVHTGAGGATYGLELAHVHHGGALKNALPHSAQSVMTVNGKIVIRAAMVVVHHLPPAGTPSDRSVLTRRDVVTAIVSTDSVLIALEATQKSVCSSP